jgi:hypothetical protein
MSYDKPIQRIATGGGLLIVLSAIAVAQTPAPRSDTRSYEVRTLLEDDRQGHAAARVQCSSDRRPTRNPSEKGAHELRPRLVIYRWGDKLYTMDDVGRNSPVNYEDQFILDP